MTPASGPTAAVVRRLPPTLTVITALLPVAGGTRLRGDHARVVSSRGQQQLVGAADVVGLSGVCSLSRTRSSPPPTWRSPVRMCMVDSRRCQGSSWRRSSGRASTTPGWRTRASRWWANRRWARPSWRRVGDAEVVSAAGAATVNVVSQAATAHFSAPCGAAAIDKVAAVGVIGDGQRKVRLGSIFRRDLGNGPGKRRTDPPPARRRRVSSGSAIAACARGSARSLVTSAPAGRSTAPVLLTVSVIPTSAPGATVAPVAGSEASATVQVGSAAWSVLVVPLLRGVRWRRLAHPGERQIGDERHRRDDRPEGPSPPRRDPTMHTDPGHVPPLSPLRAHAREQRVTRVPRRRPCGQSVGFALQLVVTRLSLVWD